MTLTPVVKIGVSRCLLGDAVRYDGRDSRNNIVLETLAALFELVPVCPEVEAGLSIPRPPVQLTGSIEQPRVTGRDNTALDITDIMHNYCAHKPSELNDLCGYVFKSRSPSCGLNSTPVFIDGVCVTETSRGVFARVMSEQYPGLPMIEETQLEKDPARFIQAVNNYAGTP